MLISTRLILALFFIVSGIAAYAQVNPYKSIGKQGKVLSGFNGKYPDVYDLDTIQRIGSVMLNIRTHRIVKLLDPGKVYEKFSDNSASSRWLSVDPLANTAKNYSYSPYSFVKNDPIVLVDPDGADWFNYQAKGEDQASWHWQKGHKATYTNLKGNTVNANNGFGSLVTFTTTGTNIYGAETGTLTIYNQDKVALTVENAFTGSGWWATGENPANGGFDDVGKGNYI